MDYGGVLHFVILAVSAWANPFFGEQGKQLPQSPRSSIFAVSPNLAEWQQGLKDTMSRYFDKIDTGGHPWALFSLLAFPFCMD